MIKIITGDNASGKTRFLINLMNGVLYSHKYITNIGLDNNPFLCSIPYDLRKQEILLNVLESDKDFIFYEDGLNLCGERLSPAARGLIDLLSREIDDIYLDEPEFNLNQRDLGVIIEYIIRIDEFHKSIYIVTHECGFAAVLDNKDSGVYVVGKDGELVRIKDDVYASFD